MGQTLEGADTVHRVKPGRKPKAAPVVEVIAPVESVMDSFKGVSQAYALRIWDGQSVDVSIPERVERVVNGLRGQKLSIDVNLPHPDAARFLAKHQ